MKKSKVMRIPGIILIAAMVLSACAGKKDARDESSVSYKYDALENSAGTTAAQLAGIESKAEVTEEAEAPQAANSGSDRGSGISNSSVISANSVAQSNDKIIRRFYLDVETQDFDDLITKIDTEVNRLGGYVESSDISGKRYYYSEQTRYANIIIRVPKMKVNEFVNTVKENSNVVNKQESTENVTLQYTDIESRKRALEIEQERLFAILEKSNNLENIITLESRLSEIRYELQNYESQLRTYDNQVEYSTVTLNIQEVERMTPTPEEKKTVGDRIKNGFSDTMYDISEGIKNFVVWFVVNLPYLVIWSAVIAAIIIFVRKYMKKMKRKKLAPFVQPPQGPTPPGNANQ